MLSASMETFDSHSTHAALLLECQQTSQSSQAGTGLVTLFIPRQCFQKNLITCIYIYISQENVKPLLLLDTLYLQHRMRKSLVTQLK